jgi:hypothetical protein
MKQLIFLFVLGAILGSCDDMDKSIKDFVTDETIYPGKYIQSQISGKIGYENVVIDLIPGRIPSNQIHLGKATKTIVDYGDDQPLVIDSVCSWVKVTGLTQSKTYKFLVSTADEFGNKSVPVELSIAPFTATDATFLSILAPQITRNASDAIVKWNQNITTATMKYDGLRYSYTDKNSTLVNGESGATPVQPTLTLPDVPDNGVTVNMKYRVIPIVNKVQIIDTIWLERSLVIPPL